MPAERKWALFGGLVALLLVAEGVPDLLWRRARRRFGAPTPAQPPLARVRVLPDIAVRSSDRKP